MAGVHRAEWTTSARTVSGQRLEGTYRLGSAQGRVEFEVQADGHFTGKWINGGGDGAWRGWKQDEGAESKPAAKFGGHWLTSLGTLQLEQKGSEVEEMIPNVVPSGSAKRSAGADCAASSPTSATGSITP